MSTNPIPEKPKFVLQITTFQKVLAGVSGSMFVMALATLTPLVKLLFTPRFSDWLDALRATMAVISLFSGGVVGIPQILNMMKFLTEVLEFYKKFTQFQKEQEKDK